jgi:hypothetical protein
LTKTKTLPTPNLLILNPYKISIARIWRINICWDKKNNQPDLKKVREKVKKMVTLLSKNNRLSKVKKIIRMRKFYFRGVNLDNYANPLSRPIPE